MDKQLMTNNSNENNNKKEIIIQNNLGKITISNSIKKNNA